MRCKIWIAHSKREAHTGIEKNGLITCQLCLPRKQLHGRQRLSGTKHPPCQLCTAWPSRTCSAGFGATCAASAGFCRSPIACSACNGLCRVPGRLSGIVGS